MPQLTKNLTSNKLFSDLFHFPGSKYNHVRQDGHNILVEKMNRYFDNHSLEHDQFRKELDFINSISKKFASEGERELYSIYPYPFTFKYPYKNVEVFRDEEANMFYVYLEGKKLYYHKGFINIEDVQKHFSYISAEQDPESPHQYFNEHFLLNDSDIVADVGGAEGNFSLLIVDKVKEIVILEADSAWIEALNKTFEPWSYKVKIINKYAGNRNDTNTVTLDELFKETNLTVLKMDIEGAELGVLKKSRKIINDRNLKIVITTYHRKNDASEIQKFLEKLDYKTTFSKNYMLFVWDTLSPPYFRKGLIMASR